MSLTGGDHSHVRQCVGRKSTRCVVSVSSHAALTRLQGKHKAWTPFASMTAISSGQFRGAAAIGGP